MTWNLGPSVLLEWRKACIYLVKFSANPHKLALILPHITQKASVIFFESAAVLEGTLHLYSKFTPGFVSTVQNLFTFIIILGSSARKTSVSGAVWAADHENGCLSTKLD